MEDVIDENTRPEDVDYAEGIAVDIRKWVASRCGEGQWTSFRHSDCKEHFMKISEKYLLMACKILADQNFLLCEGRRIPVFTLTDNAIQQLEKELVLKRIAQKEKEEEILLLRTMEAEIRTEERIERKRPRPDALDQQISTQGNELGKDSITNEDQHAVKKLDVKDKVQSIRDQPFSILCKHDIMSDIASTFVVTDLNALASSIPNSNAPIVKKEEVGWDVVLRRVTALIDPVDGFCSYDLALQSMLKEFPLLDKDSFDTILQDGERLNMIMKIDDQIFPI
jgi:hypothetical protein